MTQDDRDRVWEDRAERAYDKITYHPWKVLAGIVVACFLLSVLGNALGIAHIYWGAKKAKVTLKPRVTQQVYTPENAIAQIAFFHDQCEGVNAAAQIVNNNEQTYLTDQHDARLATDPITQQQAIQSLQQDSTNVAGAKNVLATRAADYNSRSQQSTANVFKGHGLPRRIDVPSSNERLATFHIDCGPGR